MTKTIFLKRFIALLIVTGLLTGCTNNDEENYYDDSETTSTTTEGLIITGSLSTTLYLYDNEGYFKHNHTAKGVEGFIEDFEDATKSSYSEADITIENSGSWNLSDALIGSLSNDRKYGSKSVRIRNTGHLLMNFDMTDGVESLSIRHAVYGSDGSSTWQLVVSYDSGDTWLTLGDIITSSSTTLNTVTYDVDEFESVRYGIIKLSGSSNRINFDNIEMSVSTSSEDSTIATKDSNITFGNPSNASTDSDNYYLDNTDYVLSYNNSKGTANWVSWHLSTAWTGSSDRCNCFKQDASLPSNFFTASTSNYTNTGFDRGHLCPSADRNGDDDSNENTYYMTNIVPQSPDNNQGIWANFEDYLREVIDEGHEVHIIAGVIGVGGTGSNGSFDYIYEDNITVPETFWKVALILPNGSNDINRVTTATRMIAISVPNDQNISSDWTEFGTSVDDIEAITGYDFFENIPDSIENTIESIVDTSTSI
ncbi:DNA/RNA non-specific endonuclease [Cellulophaga baltica]|uniref:DNA/RNA non-specific endonuclease n=1 Tax=Cellulophaga TaxID=104264 RepID=UPI001C07678F|nr:MULTISPECIES: DNA/RNA non-specific endonuclease [Cellulophaga]MBU2995831.1 DNA/RNA non-specific endonuclease [Cellulophaga baltica]MDO6767226.1 DNA/RNA non-specific endonuclease [Cellulophaga sp. 1_MG-2023]